MPIIALLNQKGGVGKTTLSIHIATALASDPDHSPQKVLLVDADQQGSTLDWSAQRTAEPLFRVIGLPKPTLHREIPAISQDYDWVIIDGSPGVNGQARSAIAASDIVLIPVQPSPFDVWAAEDIVNIVNECAVHKPEQIARFVINRLIHGTTLSKEVHDALNSYNIPKMQAVICNRTDYAKSAKDGLTVLETSPRSEAAREVKALVHEIRALLNASTVEQSHAVAQ